MPPRQSYDRIPLPQLSPFPFESPEVDDHDSQDQIEPSHVIQIHTSATFAKDEAFAAEQKTSDSDTKVVLTDARPQNWFTRWFLEWYLGNDPKEGKNANARRGDIELRAKDIRSSRLILPASVGGVP